MTDEVLSCGKHTITTGLRCVQYHRHYGWGVKTGLPQQDPDTPDSWSPCVRLPATCPANVTHSEGSFIVGHPKLHLSSQW